MKNQATIEYVKRHRNEDVRTLALKGCRGNDDVDLPWALDQIQGWQTARRKLPSWAAVDGIVYPPHLSMEQCSSEATALYKCRIVNGLLQAERETLVDLTGGFGVDFAFMAPYFVQAFYVERQHSLCETASSNFELLGLDHATVIHADSESILKSVSHYIPHIHPASTLLYLDPARRDSNSSRTYAIADCTPNVLALLPDLFNAARQILIKLSPMLDWHKALSDLGDRVAHVHIVSVAGECKELLMHLSADHEGEPSVHCVNDDQKLTYMPCEDTGTPAIAADGEGVFLYEPNASIMKAGCFKVLTDHFPVKAMSADSHLFVSDVEIIDFPGRRFAITAVTTMNKKDLAKALKGIDRANVAVRNFPMSAQQLRNRLRLQDGGDCYIFGTTVATGERRLFICKKQ